jgi:hypothetical protein
VTVTPCEAPRTVGGIVHVESSEYGFAKSDQGRECLVHVKYLTNGARLKKHARISYVEMLGDRGHYAVDIRPEATPARPRSGFSLNGVR